MVKLRLLRLGKKRDPFYRVVVVDSRKARNGSYIEVVGTYNPKNKEVIIKEDVALAWLAKGAQPTDTVKSLLSKQGILKTFHEQKAKHKSDSQPNPATSQ